MPIRIIVASVRDIMPRAAVLPWAIETPFCRATELGCFAATVKPDRV
jgi:hypothetical protein